ncbi:MAG: hypothetical protein FWE26_02480 [Coriobacteriia bacterium]|nr:hypothetical protein [Coriobacteriia bacterium]
MLDFFSENGEAVAYLDDGESIFLWCGRSVAYLIEDSVYTYCGKHLRWLEDGWIYDHLGDDVLSLYTLSSIPNKSVRQTPPAHRFIESPPEEPQRTFRWSVFSGEVFFNTLTRP